MAGSEQLYATIYTIFFSMSFEETPIISQAIIKYLK